MAAFIRKGVGKAMQHNDQATPVSKGEGEGMFQQHNDQAANAEPPEAAVPSWLSVD